MSDSTKTTIYLTKAGHERLRRLKEDGHFGEMLDAYRFAFALAMRADFSLLLP